MIGAPVQDARHRRALPGSSEGKGGGHWVSAVLHVPSGLIGLSLIINVLVFRGYVDSGSGRPSLANLLYFLAWSVSGSTSYVFKA